jgi:hypothetical protein
MDEDQPVFSCGASNPTFLITFSVAGEQKTYSVCKLCENLEYFKKYVIKKVTIHTKSEGQKV